MRLGEPSCTQLTSNWTVKFRVSSVLHPEVSPIRKLLTWLGTDPVLCQSLAPCLFGPLIVLLVLVDP